MSIFDGDVMSASKIISDFIALVEQRTGQRFDLRDPDDVPSIIMRAARALTGSKCGDPDPSGNGFDNA